MRPAALVARLQRAATMRETMLPPPPSARILAWARLNAIWFRVVDVLGRRLGGAVLAAARRSAEILGLEEARLSLGSLGAPERAARTTAATWAPHLVPHGAPREEQPTAVDVRRPG